MNVIRSDEAGTLRKILKPYISDFYKNYVYNQQGDISNNDMEYTLIEPWNYWKLKLAWSTKQVWAERSCEANLEALTSKAGCEIFRTKRARVVEHAGPESCQFMWSPVKSCSTCLPSCCARNTA